MTNVSAQFALLALADLLVRKAEWERAIRRAEATADPEWVAELWSAVGELDGQIRCAERMLAGYLERTDD